MQRRKEVKYVERRYINWTLLLNRITSDYLVIGDLGRQKMEIKAGTRAIMYEESVSTSKMQLREDVERNSKKKKRYNKKNSNMLQRTRKFLLRSWIH